MRDSHSTYGLGTSAHILAGVPGIGGVAASTLARVLTVAALGGVTFDMVDSREAVGRRIVRFLFPQRPLSDQVFQDFGALDAPIRISGVIGGDDYVLRARRLQKVLQTTGSTTLVHPWWGRLRVRLVSPGEVSFSAGQLRIATFTVSVVRDPGPSATGGLLQRIEDTLSHVLETADALVDEATLACQAVLSPLVLPLMLTSAVGSLFSHLSGVWDGVIGAAPQPIQSACAPARVALAGGVAIPARNDSAAYANQVTAVLTGLPAASVNAITDPARSVIAPAQQVVGDRQTVVTPDAAADLLFAASDQTGTVVQDLAAVSPDAPSVLVLGIVARSLIISQLLAAWSGLTFVSNIDALAARDRYLDAIDALAADIENAAASGTAVSLAGLWQSVQDMRVALLADATDRIGRLPVVRQVSVPSTISAFILAYAVAGDVKSNVSVVFEDMVRRNGLLMSAVVDPGSVEVLEL